MLSSHHHTNRQGPRQSTTTRKQKQQQEGTSSSFSPRRPAKPVSQSTSSRGGGQGIMIQPLSFPGNEKVDDGIVSSSWGDDGGGGGTSTSFEEEYSLRENVPSWTDHDHPVFNATTTTESPQVASSASTSSAGKTTLSDHALEDYFFYGDYDVGSLIGDYDLPQHMSSPDDDPTTTTRQATASHQQPEYSAALTAGHEVILVDQVPSSFSGGGGYDEIFSQFGLTTGSTASRHSHAAAASDPIHAPFRRPPSSHLRSKGHQVVHQASSPGRTTTGTSDSEDPDDDDDDRHEDTELGRKRRRRRRQRKKLARQLSCRSAQRDKQQQQQQLEQPPQDHLPQSVLTVKVFGLCRLDVLIALILVVVALSLGSAVVVAIIQHKNDQEEGAPLLEGDDLELEPSRVPTVRPTSSAPSSSFSSPPSAAPSIGQETNSLSITPFPSFADHHTPP